MYADLRELPSSSHAFCALLFVVFIVPTIDCVVLPVLSTNVQEQSYLFVQEVSSNVAISAITIKFFIMVFVLLIT